jgi:hypothetical protein
MHEEVVESFDVFTEQAIGVLVVMILGVIIPI